MNASASFCSKYQFPNKHPNLKSGLQSFSAFTTDNAIAYFKPPPINNLFFFFLFFLNLIEKSSSISVFVFTTKQSF